MVFGSGPVFPSVVLWLAMGLKIITTTTNNNTPSSFDICLT